MDFSDITRGGTAPANKAKPFMGGAPTINARPKTRAVDNDVQDTNAELRMNRIKVGVQPTRESGPSELNEAVLASLNEAPDADASGVKRAQSRNRSKDPKRAGHSNNLVSGLSAYTQNIPNIVLNSSKKPTKPHSANAHPSPRVPLKESRNINQINDLRAAYGADILLGKGERAVSSQARPKSMKSNGASGLDGERKSARGPKPKEPTPLTSSPEPIAYSEAFSKLATESASPPSGGSNPDMPIRAFPEPTKRLKSSTNSSSSVGLLKSSMGLRSMASLSGDLPSDSEAVEPEALEAGSSPAYPSSPSPQPQSQAYALTGHSPPHLMSLSTRADPMSSRLTSHSVAPMAKLSATATAPVPVPTLAPALLPAPASSSLTQTHQHYGHPGQAHHYPHPQHTIVPAMESMPSSSSAHEELFDEFVEEDNSADYYIDEGEDDTESPLTERRRMSAANPPLGTGPAAAVAPSIAHPHAHAHAQTHAYGLAHPHPHAHAHAHSAVGPMPNLDAVYVDVDADDDSRPQSRKLYLGSKAAEVKPVSKAPRSAGARYGPFSPLSGPEDQTAADHGPQSANLKLKKNGSYSDVQKSRHWIEHEETLVRRPPSRQSSAFPVHLAEPPLATPPPTAKPTAPLQPIRSPDGTAVGVGVIGAGVGATSAVPRLGTVLGKSPSTKRIAIDHLTAETTSDIPITTTATANVNTNNSLGLATSMIPQPNLDAKPIKKQPQPLSLRSSVVGGEEDIHTAPAQRPPSRQKIAAQHLFDEAAGPNAVTVAAAAQEHRANATAIDRWSKTEGDVRRSSFSSAVMGLPPATDSPQKPPATAGTGRLRTANASRSSRAGVNYDPYRDGFADLEPQDTRSPFVITVSYGADEHSKGAAFGEDHPVSEQFTEVSSSSSSSLWRQPQASPVGSGPAATSFFPATHLSSKRSDHAAIAATSIAPPPLLLAPPHHARPKSVSAVEPSTTPGHGYGHGQGQGQGQGQGSGLGPSRPGRISRVVNQSQAMEPEPLRSKSAQPHTHAAGGAATTATSQMLFAKGPALEVATGRQSPVVSVGAWSEGYEHRKALPRAQNTYSLGADSGWTSPSMLQTKSSSPSTFSEEDAMYGHDEDQDTVVSEDEQAGKPFEHDMSLQSFQLESSLGEDFLSLFAPAGR